MLPISWRDLDTSELMDLRPGSTTECDEYRAEIVERIAYIDDQLKDPERKNRKGEVMSGVEYWDWRRKAVAAQTFLRSRLTSLKGQRRELEEAENSDPKSLSAQVAERSSPAMRRAIEVLEDIESRLSEIATSLEALVKRNV